MSRLSVARRSGRLVALAALLGCGSSTEPAAAPSIAIAVSAPALTIAQRDSGSVQFTLTRTNFTGDLSLSATGVPAGVSIAFTPGSLSSGTVTAKAEVTVTDAAAAATTPITVHATGTGVSESTASVSLTVNPVAVANVTVSTLTLSLAPRAAELFQATAVDAHGVAVSGAPTWASSDTLVAIVSSQGKVTTIAAGTTTISATVGGKTGSATLTVTPGALPIKGTWAMFRRAGWPNGWYNGDVLKMWDTVDTYTGLTVATEVSQQMDSMKTIGMNAFSFQVVATDSVYTGQFTPPNCNFPPSGGALWPQPRAIELTNLAKLFDTAQAKGMHVLLNLSHTHMEETPPTNAQTWLTALINTVKAHPALELVTFMGDVHVNNFATPQCGLPAEPPLWLGPSGPVYTHTKWELSLARSLGLDPRKASVEAIVGDGNVEYQAQQPNPGLYSPIKVLKQMFDELTWPDSMRTYALSFYDRVRCTGAPAGCVEVGDVAWMDSTGRQVSRTMGAGSGARAIAVEWGTLINGGVNDPSHGVATVTAVMRKYGLSGGAYWIWVDTDDSYEASLPFAEAVVHRGNTWQYNPVKNALVSAYSSP